MNIVAFVILVVAAVVFLIGDQFWSRYQRSGVSIGLFLLTVGIIVQWITATREVLFR